MRYLTRSLPVSRKFCRSSALDHPLLPPRATGYARHVQSQKLIQTQSGEACRIHELADNGPPVTFFGTNPAASTVAPIPPRKNDHSTTATIQNASGPVRSIGPICEIGNTAVSMRKPTMAPINRPRLVQHGMLFPEEWKEAMRSCKEGGSATRLNETWNPTPRSPRTQFCACS
jgi:hypothetical protein